MESGILTCPEKWECWLPHEIRRIRRPEEAEKRTWELLVLTPEGLEQVRRIRSNILLLPGGQGLLYPPGIQADHVITYGLSRRDSLTLSSLERPVLCVQRTLPRVGGGVIEPQEIPLPALPEPAEQVLPLLGLYLLRMPQTKPFLFGRI